MPIYRVTDPSTGKTLKLTGDSPPTETELNHIFGNVSQPTQTEMPQAEGISGQLPDEMNPMDWGTTPRPQMVAGDVNNFYRTSQNVGRVYPVLETALQMATSIPRDVVSGLGGILSLPWGVNKAAENVDFLRSNIPSYNPQTQYGQEFSQAANYPVEKLAELGSVAGGTLEEKGYPNLGALAHTLIQGAPLVAGLYNRTIGPGISSLKDLSQGGTDWQIARVVKDAFNQAVKPKVKGKGSAGLTNDYYQRATGAVKTIINESEGKLPQTLEETSQAIYDTLKKQHDKSSSMASEAGSQGSISDGVMKSREFLNEIINMENTPKTVKSAAETVLNDLADYNDAISPSVSENLLSHLNAKAKSYFVDRNPNSSDLAYMYEKVARINRERTDKAVDQYVGPGWQEYRNNYRDLKTIEKEVSDASLVWSRKNVKGLFDIADVPTAAAFVHALTKVDPSAAAAGAAMFGTKKYLQWKNNRDRIIGNMFKDADSIMKQQPQVPWTGGQTTLSGPPEESPIAPRPLVMDDIAQELTMRGYSLQAPQPRTPQDILKMVR